MARQVVWTSDSDRSEVFEAHYNLGNILSEKGDKKAAIDSYEFALQIKPGSAMVYNNMGNILKDSNGDFKEALDSYKKALEIEPEYFEAQQNLISLMTCFIPQEDDTNRILKVNKKIREILTNLCVEEGFEPIFPPIDLCGDNAAMIAMVGLEKFKLKQFSDLDSPAKPRWPLDEDAIFLKGAGVKL